MSRNIVEVPKHLWANDIPDGYDLTMYTARMVGALRPMKTNPNFAQFSVELHDSLDPTEMILRYTTLEAPAQELAKWENANDVTGLVMAHKGRRMFLVLAYNFSRRKWFGTSYYPHRRDRRPLGEMTIDESHNLVVLSGGLLLTGIGLLLLPIGLYANWLKSQQYRVLNPTDYRGVTAKCIADWITANRDNLLQSAVPTLDPSI